MGLAHPARKVYFVHRETKKTIIQCTSLVMRWYFSKINDVISGTSNVNLTNIIVLFISETRTTRNSLLRPFIGTQFCRMFLRHHGDINLKKNSRCKQIQQDYCSRKYGNSKRLCVENLIIVDFRMNQEDESANYSFTSACFSPFPFMTDIV